MSQEHEPGELSAEEIAYRIGAGAAPYAIRMARAGGRGVARTGGGQPSVPAAAMRDEPEAPPHAVVRPPEPRVRLMRDTATTLVGLSAVALVVLAVWPPSPTGGVLGATGRPTGAGSGSSAGQSPHLAPLTIESPGSQPAAIEPAAPSAGSPTPTPSPLPNSPSTSGRPPTPGAPEAPAEPAATP